MKPTERLKAAIEKIREEMEAVYAGELAGVTHNSAAKLIRAYDETMTEGEKQCAQCGGALDSDGSCTEAGYV